MPEDKRRTFTKEFKHKIVMLKFANKMKTKEICKMYDLDRQTIHRWVNEFNAKGMSAWERKRRSTRRHSRDAKKNERTRNGE